MSAKRHPLASLFTRAEPCEAAGTTGGPGEFPSTVEMSMPRDDDFEADRGTGAMITAFVVLAIVALAALYMLFPVDKDAGKDTPQSRVSQTAPANSATGTKRE